MREIPSKEPYSRESEKIKTIERRNLTSLLKGPNGEVPELSVAIAEDGAARRVNFWDIDKTVLWAHDVHFETVTKLFPEAAAKDTKDLQHTFEAGWRLGNSFREWDRMHRIFIEGQKQYRDPVIYRREFIENDEMRKKLDEPGHSEGWHERGARYLAKCDIEASAVLKRMYSEGKIKENVLIPAMVHLLEAKTRLGELNAFMTANPREFSNGLLTYSGLYKYGFALASDEDFVGGGKEVGIEHLMQLIESNGITVPKHRLVVLGDAEKGDVGSGYRLMKRGDYTFEGVLVRKDIPEAEVFKRAAESDPELKDMLKTMNVTVIASENAPQIDGQYKLGRLGSANAAKSQENKES